MTKETELQEAIKDHFTPEAVAAIAAYLEPACCGDETVDRQIRWFVDQLVELLGGEEFFRQTCEELGL